MEQSEAIILAGIGAAVVSATAVLVGGAIKLIWDHLHSQKLRRQQLADEKRREARRALADAVDAHWSYWQCAKNLRFALDGGFDLQPPASAFHESFVALDRLGAGQVFLAAEVSDFLQETLSRPTGTESPSTAPAVSPEGDPSEHPKLSPQEAIQRIGVQHRRLLELCRKETDRLFREG